MSKNSFKIDLKDYKAKSPVDWMMTTADIPEEFIEDEINKFAEDLRTRKFQDVDFDHSLILRF